MPVAVSVVIPVYNAAGTLGQCLETILAQDAPFEFEVVAVDDGSGDSTPRILREFAARHAGRLRIIRQDNAGPASARNAGALAAKGELLVFTDSDCSFEKDFLDEIIRPLFGGDKKGPAGVQGRYKTLQKSLTARFCQQEIEERYNIYRKGSSITMVGTYAAAYRKDVFLEMGLFDTRFPIASGEDSALSLKMVKHGYRLVFQDTAVCYHSHPETVGKYYRQKYGRAYWRNLLYKLHPDRMVSDSYTPQTLKIQVALSLLLYPQAALLIGSLLSGDMVSATVAALAVNLTVQFLSVLPLVVQALRGDAPVACLVPFYSIVRSLALASGLMTGFFSIHVRGGGKLRSVKTAS